MELSVVGKGPNYFKVNLIAKNFDNDSNDKHKLLLAITKMADVMSSEDFKDFVLNYYYQSYKCTGSLWNKKCKYYMRYRFRYNKDKTREQIYNHLMTGSEVLLPEEDNEADIRLKLDKSYKKGVLGYTYPNTVWQWIYNWFFSEGTVDQIAGNLAHEWCHKMGYGHESKYNKYRRYTVPYAIGYFVRDFDGYIRH